MTYVTIPLFVFIILIIAAVLLLALVCFEIFVCSVSLKMKSDYEKGKIKKYGTYDDSEN